MSAPSGRAASSERLQRGVVISEFLLLRTSATIGTCPSARRRQATRLHDYDDADEPGPSACRPLDGACAGSAGWMHASHGPVSGASAARSWGGDCQGQRPGWHCSSWASASGCVRSGPGGARSADGWASSWVAACTRVIVPGTCRTAPGRGAWKKAGESAILFNRGCQMRRNVGQCVFV